MKVWMETEHLTGKMVVQLPIQIGLIIMVIMVAITVVMAGEVVTATVVDKGRMKKKIIGMMEAMIKRKKDIIQLEMKLRKTLKCLLNLSQNG
jgi:hypothetical protein